MLTCRDLNDYLHRPEDDVELILEDRAEYLLRVHNDPIGELTRQQRKAITSFIELEACIVMTDDDLSRILGLFPSLKASLADEMREDSVIGFRGDLLNMISTYLLGMTWPFHSREIIPEHHA